jgi:uncharacterized membrane protein YuzA (DUF378 family)
MRDEAKNLKTVHWIALVLAIIGAINWGLVGLFQFDLVAAVLGGMSSGPARVVYTLVGIAGVVLMVTAPRLEALRAGTRVPVVESR